MGVTETFIAAVDNFTPDIDRIYADASRYTLADWQNAQRAMVGASGAAAVAIPVAHLAGIAADLAFVVNRMGVSTFGTGAILGSDNGYGNILEKEDFGAVLAYWSGDEGVREAMNGKGAADLASKAGFKLATKLYGKAAAITLTQTMLASSGYLIGQKLGGKAMAKVASKVAAKFAGKTAAGFIPFLGPAVGGGINLWLISQILDAAQEFYTDKVRLLARVS
ncbi:MAG: hypothetical protein KGP27_11500 [Hyphomicrobiales bacterium]|nr:hypothetical protein [Hyphomicrobiales bacterium]